MKPTAYLVQVNYRGTMSGKIYTEWYGPWRNLSTARAEVTKVDNGNWRNTRVIEAIMALDGEGHYESTSLVEAFVIGAKEWECEG